MKAMLDILSVQVLPNPVETGASYRIVADVRPIDVYKRQVLYWNEDEARRHPFRC